MNFQFPPFGRSGGDPAERFMLFVEQLQQATELLTSGRLARERMALVALDNLAEGLIYNHLQVIFFASDEPTWVPHREFPARERREAERSFNKRVELAAEALVSSRPVFYPEPILDSHDAVVFRVAHHYRNPVYHQDRHNPTLIQPVGRLYAQAVARAFVRSHREGVARGFSRESIQQLTSLGWLGSEGSYVTQRAAAEVITRAICDPLAVNAVVLPTELADDIAYRCDAIDEDLNMLRRDAFVPLEDFLIQVQDWAANRGDEHLMKLKEEHRLLENKGRESGAFDDATLQAMRELERQQWDYLFGSDRVVTAKVDLDSHLAIRRKGKQLGKSRSSEAYLLEQYRQLDDELQIIEAAVDMMLSETDRRTWEEESRARGN